jgi:hypothetical protein
VQTARARALATAARRLPAPHVLGPVPVAEVDVMAKRPQGLLNVGTLSARMAVLRVPERAGD